MIDITTLIGYLITPITALFGWLAGTRSRKNSVFREMMSTIHDLSRQNAVYNQSIIDLQNEIIEVRRENAELKSGQEEMTKKINELQEENKELKELLTNKS